MKVSTVDMLDRAQIIEDGVLALCMIATTNHDEITDEYSFRNAYNYVHAHVMDDLATLRADLTERMATEEPVKIAE